MPTLDSRMAEATLRSMIDNHLTGRLHPGENGVRWMHAQGIAVLVDLDAYKRSWQAPAQNELLDCLGGSGQLPEAVQRAALFFAGADGNGHNREWALERMPALPGYLTLVSALLRCNDWVARVRLVAQRVAESLLPRCSSAEVLAAWPLVVRLGNAKRVDAQWLRDTFCGWLSAPAQQGILDAMLDHDDARLRLGAYEVALATHPDRVEIRARALRDSDPRIARIGFQSLVERGDDADVEAQCRLALTACSGRVRTMALRALVAREPGDVGALIENAAFDRARAVRRLAAYLLRQRQATPAIELWRTALAQRAPGRWRQALEALADHAEAEDVAGLRTLHAEVSARHQRNCVRGWMRGEGGASLALLRVALESQGHALDRLLATARPHWAGELDAERLMSFCHDGPSPVAQAGLLRLLPVLPRWQHLELLLAAVPQGADERAWLQRLADNWLQASLGYVPLFTSRRQSLLDTLEQGRHHLPLPAATQVLALLRKT